MDNGTCKHFNGLRDRDNCCAAGVNYAQAFDISKPGIALRMPFHQFHERPAHGRGTYIKPGEAVVRLEIDRRGETMMSCPHLALPTPEEVEADRVETEAFLAKTMAAIKVASTWRVKPKPAQTRHEIVECPVCKGKLHLSQSSYNGHVHGKCETANCVAWME